MRVDLSKYTIDFKRLILYLTRKLIIGGYYINATDKILSYTTQKSIRGKESSNRKSQRRVITKRFAFVSGHLKLCYQ